MSGALLLGVVSLVVVVDYLIALRFLAMANRADGDVGAAPKPGTANPAALRRVARLLMFTAPLMWLVVAALSFGMIPVDGITAIKF